MSRRHQHGKSLKRIIAKRPELRTIVVFCEGKQSEPDYVKGLKKLSHIARNTALNLELYPEHGVPLVLVQKAVERKKDPEVDECWCLFDVEWPKNHPNLTAAVELARLHDIRLAISNPCFEIWLILHYKDFTKFANTDSVERASRLIDKRPGKSIDASMYMPLRKDAIRRAEILTKHHERNGTVFPKNNPSSGMHEFLTALEQNTSIVP